MLAYSREAVELTQGRTREDLGRDRLLVLGLQRLVEIVGEAANRVSKATQAEFPEIPWQPIIGMRNRLIHGYDVIDVDVVWGP
jgi:uncharacterized protein with HEPN domain